MTQAQGSPKPSETTIPLHDADSIAPGDASIGALVGNVTTHVSTLFRSEVELAKKEVGEQVKRAVTGSGFFAAALVLLILSLLPFVLMWGYLVSMWFGTLTWHWLGFLIVFAFLVVVAAICGLIGYIKVKKISKPQRTLDSVNDLKLSVQGISTEGPGAIAPGDSAAGVNTTR